MMVKKHSSQWLIAVLIFLFYLIACQFNSKTDTAGLTSIPDKIDFNFHVRPILSDRCYKCHGPDEKARKANLRLDLEEYAFAILDSTDQTYAIVPGDLSKSLLFHRIASQDPEEMMPPPESNLSLTANEIEILKKWIEQGAEWKAHWAFISPEKADLPTVSNPSWPKNEIDHFILNRLDQEGPRPNPEASKEKQIRRLSFDLRGLPPSLEEIDAFLADDSEYAYEKVVDRFMAEKRHGERMAMEWLDVARYADSHGYQDDIERSMWPWRDWVIKAFNENMPYDEFVSWQLAGDLMPNATYEQKLATGFNRNHKITQEVGVIDEEYRVNYVLDRVNTTSTAFLGLTVACAQCHDHKFDPISQKEFYSLFSFFNSVPERGRVEYNVEVADPSVPIPEETVTKLTQYIEELLQDQRKTIDTYEKEQWEKEPNLSLNLPINSPALPKGLQAHYALDYVEESIMAEEFRPKRAANTFEGVVPVQGKFSGGLEFSGNNYVEIPKPKGINFNRAFSISFWIKNLHDGIRGPVLNSLPTKEKNPHNLQISVGNDKSLYFRFIGKGKNNRLSIRTRETVPANRWVQVVLTHDGSKKGKGIQMWVDGKLFENIVSEDKFRGRLLSFSQMRIGKQGKGKGLMAAQLDEFMFFDRALEADEVQALVQYHPLQELLSKREKSEHDQKRLFYHQLFKQDASYLQLIERLREYKIKEGRLADVVLKPTMVMADMDSMRPTFILDRGQYDAPTARVYAGTPASIGNFPADYPKNRLGLAKWLFDDSNPLSARVAVNRYWQMIFGRGIVATPEDFGSQGELPSHPALLDWLAVDFRESGWNVRKLLKRMVMSATYRQSVTSSPAKLEKDASNIFLARGPQQRLQAEMVRDHALSISGLLSPQIGGPSVKPYHPEGLWLETASGNQPLRVYIQDHGEALYRRSMYTFWKRTVPPPSMITFDAPTREQCEVRRQSTSTPMQALVLLNDPQFTEASRLIAERMLREGGEDAAARIGFAFRLATSRKPNQQELRLLQDLLAEEKGNFEATQDQAIRLLAVGETQPAAEADPIELAAYTVVANAILNLTETIRKG